MVTKKTSKKNTTKIVKTPVKKKTVVKKTGAVKKTLKKANPEMAFYFSDGTNCSDLFELSESLEKLSDDMFNHHVADDFNHFSDWIEHVLGEKELATKLRETKSKDKHRAEILTVIVRYLK